MEQTIAAQTDTLWQEKIDDWLASGMSMARWCKEYSVPYNQFIYRKYKLEGRRHGRVKATAKQFVELIDRREDPGITIECGDVHIRVTSDFDEAVLQRCLQVVQRTTR